MENGGKTVFHSADTGKANFVPSNMHDLPSDLKTQLSPSLRERNKRMYNNSLMSDINFIVRDSETERKISIPAHKYVLAIGSPVFYKMFYGDLSEKSDSVELVDADSDSLLELFRFLYSDETHLTADCVLRVMYLAEKYMIPGLLDECSEFLSNEIDSNNALDILKQCEFFSGTEKLQERCWSIVDLQTRQCLRSKSFLSTSETILEALVKRETLDIDECELYRAVISWAEAQCKALSLEPIAKNIRKFFGGVMAHIRFSFIKDSDLLNNSLARGILTLEDSQFTKQLCASDFALAQLNHDDSPLRPITAHHLSRQGIKPVRCSRLFVNEPPRLFVPYESTNSVCFIADQPVCISGVRIILSGQKLNENYAVITKLLDGNRTSVSCVQGNYTVEFGGTEGLPGFDVYFTEPVLVRKGAKYFITMFSPAELDLPQCIGKKDQVNCAGVNFYFPDSTHRQFPELIFNPLAPLW